MPAMEHIGNYKWKKVCHRCKKEFFIEGAKTWDKAAEALNKYFHYKSATNRGHRTMDDLYPLCRGCYADVSNGRSNISDRETLLMKQNYLCAICKTKIAFNGRYSAVVDHNHSTGMSRGVLCHKCNHGLGNFNENTDSLRRAIIYLVKHQ